MKFYREEWLPHLEGVIPDEARRNRTSLYTIALEGWRRGLRLKFYTKRDNENKKRLYYSLQSSERIHFFSESCGDKNTEEALDICDDKSLTYNYLEKANVPIPLGKNFDCHSSIDDIVRYAEKLGYPLVVKPKDGKAGRGVAVNIQDENTLKNAINRVKDLGYDSLIVQQHVEGKEIRIYVLNNKVIAAANRIPANVIGDGHSTIAKLIEIKNEFRKQIPHLYYRPIKIDAEVRNIIADAGYSLDTILKKGERLFLRKVSNVSTGGDPIDYTDKLTKKQKEIAIAATNAIPGLTHCGVDMIVDEKNGTGVILEINTRPGIGTHLFPVEGKARDIPKAIIDYYFPETIGNRNLSSKAYFDLQTVYDYINGGYLSEIEIKPFPVKAMHSIKLEIKGELDIVGYFVRINKYVIKQNISGFIKKLDESTIEIVISHEDVKKIEEFKEYLLKRSKHLKIDKIKEHKWDYPVKIGFFLINGLSQKSFLELEHEYNQSYKELRSLELETSRLEKRIKLIKSSKSWKVTAPIRTLKKLFRAN